MSDKNYQRITQTSAATATRDLADLLLNGGFVKTGKQRNTRYWLAI